LSGSGFPPAGPKERRPTARNHAYYLLETPSVTVVVEGNIFHPMAKLSTRITCGSGAVAKEGFTQKEMGKAGEVIAQRRSSVLS
jgi:hypothetical protein